MSGGSRNQTQTTTSEPPSYLRPYLWGAASESQRLYDQGPQSYYPGETVVGFAPETEQALGGTAARATNGSPINQAASGFAARTLGNAPTTQYGNGQNPFATGANPYGSASNPHLDAMFNKAADSVQNRLSTQFAGSGRNIEASRAANAQELNDLATNIYGSAYDAERNRQLQYGSQQLGIGAQGYELERDRAMTDIAQQRQQQLGTLGMAPSVANQDYVDLERLAGVGAAREDLTGRQYEDAAARWDYSQQAPGLHLDQYITRLQGMPGSSVTSNTPIYRNTGAGILGGALAGSQIGAGLNDSGGYPGWGALIGGLLGGYG